MNEITFFDNGKLCVRISKSEAKKRHDTGKSFYMLASKLNPNSPWCNPLRVMSSDVSKNEDAFQRLCDMYSTYNCTAETGMSINFFKRAKD